MEVSLLKATSSKFDLSCRVGNRAQRQLVQHPPHVPPPGHALIEQSEKLSRMSALAEMRKLMQDNVIKALRRLLS